jgi:hypothetical protein
VAVSKSSGNAFEYAFSFQHPSFRNLYILLPHFTERPEEGASVTAWVLILFVNAVVAIRVGLGDFRVYTKCIPPVPAHSPTLWVSHCVLSPLTQPSATPYKLYVFATFFPLQHSKKFAILKCVYTLPLTFSAQSQINLE